MAVSQQQKVDFLLKKLGFTKTKTGLAVDSTLTGTKKAGFAEAIPSPLIIANSSVWNEADSIPATPPGSDTNQVKVYLAASSGHRMTVDSTVAGNRAFIAFSTYNDTSSTRLNNWIDTQFGAGYLIKVFKGDPNSGGVQLSAAGSGNADGWFFDYSAGVLNFNDTNVPSGVQTDNIYIVGYRYIGQTGAPTSGISTFSFLDLTVERNLDVGVQGGISTFRNNIDLNADLDVDGHTNLDNVSIAGVTTIAQNAKAVFGNNGELEIFRSATESAIVETQGNNLSLAGNRVNLLRADRNTVMLQAIANGAVELYHNNVLKAQTSSDGFDIPADSAKLKLGASGDLTLFHDGSDSYVLNNTGNLNLADTNHLYFRGNTSDKSVSVFFNGSEKLTTTSSGVTVTGTVTETSDIAFKSDIEPITNTLDKLQQITGYKYKLDNASIDSMGVIAQDVEKVFPELVHGDEGSKTLQYSGLIGVLVEAVKDLSAKVKKLESN